MNNIGMLILGLVLGAFGGGGYMYAQLQSVQQTLATVVGARDVAAKAGKALEDKVKSSESAKTAVEMTLKQAKEEMDKFATGKKASDSALAEAKGQLMDVSAKLTDTTGKLTEATGKLTALQTAQQAAEKLMKDIRDQLAQAQLAKDAAEKALLEAKK